jgi:hypothetical protein
MAIDLVMEEWEEGAMDGSVAKRRSRVCWVSAGRGAALAGQSDDQLDKVGMVLARATTVFAT